jgi:lipopolysaccharide transport system ATP-binding protein
MSATDEPVLCAANLGKRYPLHPTGRRALLNMLFPGENERWALRGLSFELQRGQTLGVIGRNGSGKSTLLALACGTLQPTEGTIRTRGRIAALLELGAGFHGEFTGRENVHMNGRLHGLSKAQIDARLPAIAAFADIGEALERPVKTYSTGMYLRLAFAVAAHVDAELLVIDEALAVGDALFVQKCMRYLREFQQRGAILFVSHDPAAITSLCTQALWLDQGVPRKFGAPKEVCEAYHAHLSAAPGEAPAAIDSDPAAFGDGRAAVTGVTLWDRAGAALAAVRGHEAVRLEISVEARAPLAHPIIGFYVKDRHGQQLFGENTAGGGVESRSLEAGAEVTLRFTFTMPALPPGEYTIDAAVADGTPAGHRIVHWRRDAALFRSLAPDGHRGLVGIPVAVEAVHRR